MEFTPGPWEVEGLAIYKLDDNGNHKLSIQIRPDLNAKQSYSELCCNARLIAAAPDMYEALVNCKDILNKIGCGTAFHVMDKIVTEALQKARGKGNETKNTG